MALLVLKIDTLVEQYANAVGRYGPDSPQALSIRQENAENEEFLKFADSMDRIKRAVGGSGIDTKPSNSPQEALSRVRG
jgi:uncharacterized protein (DUF4213/DUF364 family)